MTPLSGGKHLMRRATFFLLVFLCGPWVGSFGQHVPKFTTPRIVATFQRLGQTKEIKPVSIYTPPQWGTFRISIVMVGTVANRLYNSHWEGGLQFTDGAGENLPGFTVFAAELFTVDRGTATAEFPVRAKAGTPLKFSVTSKGGDTSGSKYNVWVVVEQLM
jgi:hypothetical protein